MLRQQALPYIYGYRSNLNRIARVLKNITMEVEDAVVGIVLDWEGYVNVAFDFSTYSNDHVIKLASNERNRAKRDVAIQIYERLLGWDLPIRNEHFEAFGEGVKSGYAMGRKDGAIKLSEAVKKHKGIYAPQAPQIALAIRREKQETPVSYVKTLESQAIGEQESYTRQFAYGIAIVAAGTIIKKSLTTERKNEDVERDVRREFRKNKAANTAAKAVLWVTVAAALEHYYTRQKVKFHQWVSDNPQDTPCIIPTNEIVPVGTPFSNGYIFAGYVHKYCHCTTTPVNVSDVDVYNYGKFYNIL